MCWSGLVPFLAAWDLHPIDFEPRWNADARPRRVALGKSKLRLGFAIIATLLGFLKAVAMGRAKAQDRSLGTMNSAADSRSTVAGPLPGDLVAGKYRISRVLGEGGMGRVLAAVNVTTGKNVALKWVLNADSPDAMVRFSREARAAGRIHHANVVDVYDVVQHESATCLVMELLRGDSLAAILQRDVRLPVSEAVGIAIEAARGLDAAHREHVIHRDLKPANLFLCAAGGNSRVKVLDFGISKTADADDLSPVTRTGVVLGTPHYMSPEQVRGVKNIDHRVDVYALGAVLYEMLAGRPPLDHESMTALLVDIATIDPAPIETMRDEVPPELSKILMRALAKDPNQRYPDVASFAKDLQPFSDGTKFDPDAREWSQRVTAQRMEVERTSPSGLSRAATMPATPPVATNPPDTQARQRIPPAAILAVVVVGVLVIAFGTWLLWPSSPEPPVTRVRPPAIAHDGPTRREPAPPGASVVVQPPAQTPTEEPAPTTSTEGNEPEARRSRRPHPPARTERTSGPRTAGPEPAVRGNPRSPRAGTLSVDDF
jgi:serine/threonine-protein kinase